MSNYDDYLAQQRAAKAKRVDDRYSITKRVAMRKALLKNVDKMLTKGCTMPTHMGPSDSEYFEAKLWSPVGPVRVSCSGNVTIERTLCLDMADFPKLLKIVR